MARLNNLDRINISFIAIFVILAFMMTFWLFTIRENNRLLEFVINENHEAMLFHDMVHAMHHRTIALYRMSATDDVFEADAQMMHFMMLAEKFIKTRDLVLAGEFTEKEKTIWQSVIPNIKDAQLSTREVLELINRGDIAKARIVLESKVRPNQEVVVSKLNELIKEQNNTIRKHFDGFNRQSKLAFPFAAGFTITLMIIAFMVFVTLRRKKNAESELIKQGERIRTLYEISSISGTSTDEQIRETLNFGRILFGTEIAKISLIDGIAGTNTVTYLVAPEEIEQAMPGVLPLDKTLCSIVHNTEKPLILSHSSESEYRQHPSMLSNSVETYAAVPIWVNEKKYGTVCFANRAARKEPFSETEIDLIQLIGRWVSVTIERQISEQVALEKKEAVAANRAKSDFLATMSHEIRTPLNAIIGFAEASLHTEPDKQQLDESLQTIVRSGHHLLQVINNTLDLSKIESGNMPIEKLPVDLFDLIEDVDVLIRSKAEEKGLNLSIEPLLPLPGEIETDAVKLKQILINLLNNAVKFTDSGSIKLVIEYHQEKQKLHFAVIDSGIGLSDMQREIIFEPFTQADISTTRKYGGTGLGLSVCKKLVSMLGGDITVKSDVGLGSRFDFEIGVGAIDDEKLINKPGKRKLPASAEKPTAVSHLVGHHILIVDDNSDNQRLLEMILKNTGVNLGFASNGQEAIDVIEHSSVKFDLVLMDMQMPVMDGYTAVARLREDNYLIPIVALTADIMQESHERCMNSGCDEVMTKPVQREQLLQLLGRFLKPDDFRSGQQFVNELVENDPEFRGLVHEFLGKLPDEIDKLRTDIQNREQSSIQFRLHDIKGVAGNLGYTKLGHLAEEMEQSAKRDDYTQLSSLLDNLAGYIASLLVAHGLQAQNN